jgi:D-beta-D-heptose 7-phosphate kinase/D-beta-D-heptose 1-phosphate adenosyltransferase
VTAVGPRAPDSKILSQSDAARWRRETPGRVVFTNGVFDLLHPGHVAVLVGARACGDALVVGLNSDDSVRRLKGDTRPVTRQDARAYVLAALECVDAVTIFDDDTPLALIRLLRPDVLVKGGDYRVETIVGAPDVIAAGGEVRVLPLVPGHSTTRLVDKLRGIDATAARA